MNSRKQSDICFVHSVFISLADSSRERELCEKGGCFSYVSPSGIEPEISDKKKNGRVCIAGFGPAGIFCGMVLAEYGYRPLILEKGEDIDRIYHVGLQEEEEFAFRSYMEQKLKELKLLE